MSIDFTARKRAEDALREAKQAAEDSKAQYELIVSMISDIVWRYDVNAQAEHVGSYISPVVDRMLGLPDGTIGDSFDKYFSYVHPDDLPAVQEILFEVIRTLEKDRTAEYRLRKVDGTTRWVRSKGSAYCQPDGRVAVFGTTSDITERKQAEEALRRQNVLLQTILDNIPIMIAFLDCESHHQLVNRCWQSTLGWSLEEAMHKDVLAETYPDPAYRKYVLDFIKRAAGSWGEFKTRTRDGRVLDTSWANVPLSDGSNIGIGIIVLH